MTRAGDYSKYLAMREATGPSTTTTEAWTGEERRASFRAAADRHKHGPQAASDAHEIFRATIVHEIKNGKLSTGRRRRILRYAARMGLSAVEAGQLLADCREQAISELEACKETPSLRLHVAGTDDNTTANRVVIAVAAAVLVNAAIILLFA